MTRTFLYPPFPLSGKRLKEAAGADFYKVWLEDGRWFGVRAEEVGRQDGTGIVLIYRDPSRTVGYYLSIPAGGGAAVRARLLSGRPAGGRRAEVRLAGAGGTPYLVLQRIQGLSSSARGRVWALAVGPEGAVCAVPECSEACSGSAGKCGLIAVGRRGVLAALLSGEQAAGLGSYEDYLWLVDAVRSALEKHVKAAELRKTEHRPLCQTVLCSVAEDEAVCIWQSSTPLRTYTHIYACGRGGGCWELDRLPDRLEVALFGGRPAAGYARYLAVEGGLIFSRFYFPDSRVEPYLGRVRPSDLKHGCSLSLRHDGQIFLAAGGACMEVRCGGARKLLCASPAGWPFLQYDPSPTVPFASVADDIGQKKLSVPS